MPRCQDDRRRGEVSVVHAREEKRAKARKTKEVAKARMGVGKGQPSITDRFKAKTGVAKPTMSIRPSKVPLVTLGQSNGSPSISPVKQRGVLGAG